ncbi:MAG: fumarylacetoacetate hydrolase family protein [Gemmatimonadaceae bacterium]|nr:fumarylacetoacetate hydrolase family protein [Gemmatimonadaceae bacterium]
MTERIARFEHDGREGYGALSGDDTLDLLEDPGYDGPRRTGEQVALADVCLLAPVADPRLIGVGLNYAEHAAESGLPAPDQPMLFHLPTTAVCSPGDDIVYPRQGSVVHYEGELAVVIGTPARRVSAERALDHVFGYTIGNDVSERVIQKAEMANGCLLISKGFDTFKPLGPWIATGLDPSDLQLTTRLNGRVVQSTSTADLIFTVGELIEYISAAVTLLPGDVIMTGTPSGVGEVQPGDVVEIEIEGIGVLRNPVAAEETA